MVEPGEITVNELENTARRIAESSKSLPVKIFLRNFFEIFWNENEIESFKHFSKKDWQQFRETLSNIVKEFFEIEDLDEAIKNEENLGKETWEEFNRITKARQKN